jgi:flagellar L-ring protein precursor FlgH
VIRFLLSILLLACFAYGENKRAADISPIDRYIAEASQAPGASGASPGSMYSGASRLADLTRDLRAAQINDIVTVVVSDRASAVSRGATTSSRSGSARGSIGAIGGVTTRGLSGLANLSGESELQGQGETSRESVLTTTVSARVTHVLPNGNMVVEGSKDVMVNSERQLVTIRGVIRWNDLTPANTIRSDRIANLEIRVNGKGVVGDAVRRPNFLYRLLLGLLPF